MVGELLVVSLLAVTTRALLWGCSREGSLPTLEPFDGSMDWRRALQCCLLL